jgi:hypothetical protein
MQRGKRGVAYAVRAEELKRRELGQPSSVDSWQAMRRYLEMLTVS